MSTDVWQPLSSREIGSVSLREDIPLALRGNLRAWLLGVGIQFPELTPRVLLRMDVPVPDGPNATTAWSVHVEHGRDETLLDTVDAMLDLMPTKAAPDPWGVNHPRRIEDQTKRQVLRQYFTDARSVYTVNRAGTGLERRVSPIAAAMVGQAIKWAAATADAGSAPVQLKAAANAVRALRPEPDKAYSLAVKAVESAAHAVIEPGNAKATLGTMIRTMRDNPGKFEIAIGGKDGKGDAQPLIAMMTLLWEGQSSRHGARTPTLVESPEAAEMAVQLASTLVLWFTTGMAHRSTGS